MRYFCVDLDNLFEEMRVLLRQYSTREVESKAYVDHCTVSRFIKGKSIRLDDLIGLHRFLRDEEEMSNIQIKAERRVLQP